MSALNDAPLDAARVRFRTIGPEAAAEVLAVVRASFGARPRLDPPADADAETVDSLAAALSGMGGLLAEVDGEPIGTVILDAPAEYGGERIYLRRFGVIPQAQGLGVAGALAEAALLAAAQSGAAEVAVIARQELPRSVGFWRTQGFVDAGAEPPYLTLLRPLPLRYEVGTPEQMHHLGERLARVLRAGDVVVLIGDLGAGKTTLTQGLGHGLRVRGAVTSPTFVIARVHPSLVGGPDLVHVDAYRLGGVSELDDLDLDTSLEEAVTVVEWGEGLAEGLSDSRLEIRIGRAAEAPGAAELGEDALAEDELGGADGFDGADGLDGADGPLDPRTVELRPIGPRWSTSDWSNPGRG